jgi:hypothetical protein
MKEFTEEEITQLGLTRVGSDVFRELYPGYGIYVGCVKGEGLTIEEVNEVLTREDED